MRRENFGYIWVCLILFIIVDSKDMVLGMNIIPGEYETISDTEIDIPWSAWEFRQTFRTKDGYSSGGGYVLDFGCYPLHDLRNRVIDWYNGDDHTLFGFNGYSSVYCFYDGNVDVTGDLTKYNYVDDTSTSFSFVVWKRMKNSKFKKDPYYAIAHVYEMGEDENGKKVKYVWTFYLGKGAGRPEVSFVDSEDSTREVKGIAADGNSRVVIKISNLTESTTLDDIEGEYVGTDGCTWMGDQKIVDNVYTQTMTAPEFFVRQDHSSEDRSQGSRKMTLKVSVKGQELDVPEFSITKAPVVLLHGLWSDSSTWEVFKEKLKNEYGYEYIYAMSYANSVHFTKNSTVINTAIKRVLGLCKNDGIIAKKADVVAHSMGGLLTKLNGNASNIKSITTVGTPHLGSECADILYGLVDDADSSSSEKFIADLLAANDKPANNGAIEDLKTHTDGSAIVAGNKINVPTHTIAGITSVSEDSNVFFVNLLLRVCKFFGTLSAPSTLSSRAFNQYIFEGEKNDWIVSEKSQKGGLQGDDVDVTWHGAETDNLARPLAATKKVVFGL